MPRTFGNPRNDRSQHDVQEHPGSARDWITVKGRFIDKPPVAAIGEGALQSVVTVFAQRQEILGDLVDILPSYRRDDGRLTAEWGPVMPGFSFIEAVIQYSPEEKASEVPYPGLAAFKTARESRDRHFGSETMP